MHGNSPPFPQCQMRRSVSENVACMHGILLINDTIWCAVVNKQKAESRKGSVRTLWCGAGETRPRVSERSLHLQGLHVMSVGPQKIVDQTFSFCPSEQNVSEKCLWLMKYYLDTLWIDRYMVAIILSYTQNIAVLLMRDGRFARSQGSPNSGKKYARSILSTPTSQPSRSFISYHIRQWWDEAWKGWLVISLVTRVPK